MVLVHVLKRRPVRRLWVAGLVCCVLLGVELGLDVLYARRGPVHGLLQGLVRLEIKAFLYLVLLGGVKVRPSVCILVNGVMWPVSPKS